MARGRRRRGAGPSQRRAWYAGAAALAAVVAVLVAYATSSGGGGGRGDGAGRTDAAGLRPSTTAPGRSPAPSTLTPSSRATASATAGATAPRAPEHSAAARTAAPRPSAAPAGKRLITVVNRTPQTVWAVVTGTPAYPAGRKLAPGASMSVTVANSWGGRVWGRTGCASTAAGHCASGDCTSVCTGANPPTTLGEFTFDAYAGMDFYDVSMVDGSNLPMYINVSHTTTADPVSPSGCYKGACTSGVDCPAAMQARSGGRVVGCKPPCAAFGGDTYCCRGAWAGRENCVPAKWPVDYTQVFKRAEPYAYSYAFDDSATMACKGACYYTVTFGTTSGG
ncbi:thaumatin family protein [Streptomyces sp. NPDC021020]|uniref:thaumatin family protein n=1 Tax=Streptomyces sp. NPDC021020 TaxID=3365109 RepID=UPI00379D81A3